MKLDLPLIIMLTAIAIAAGAVIYENRTKESRFDRAQATFEKSDARATMYNWPVFKQANSWSKLECKDSGDRALRTCVIRSKTVDPMTSELSADLHIVDSFACSVATCEWVGR